MAEVDKNEQAEKRLRFAAKAIGEADLPSSLLADIMGKAETELEKRSEDPELISIHDLKEDIEQTVKDYGQFGKNALTTGLDIVDKMIGGLKPAEVTLICANSNVGKSWLCSDMAVICSAQAPTLFITLEMRAEVLGARMKIFIDKYNGKESDDWDGEFDLYFQKAKTLDYRNIKKLFEKASEQGIKAVFIDYLQYLGVGMEAREMAKISRMFHELALVHNIPIVIVASLRKDSIMNKRKWFETDENDVSGVGAIVYDCDNLLCAGRTDPENDEYTPDAFWVKHIKSRNMPVDRSYPFGKMKWDGGCITNDEEWFNEIGQYYGGIESRPIKRTKDEPAKQTEMDWTAGITDDKIESISEFEMRKKGLVKAISERK